METDNLMGAKVRIRRGWHGGRTGKVIVCDHRNRFSSLYSLIKVQLDGGGQVVNINTIEDLETFTDQTEDSHRNA